MGGLEFFLLPLLLIGLLWFMGAPQRRMRKEQAALMASLSTGADVMTHGGLYGTVVEIEDDVIVLETSPGVTMRWAKRAIATVVTPVADEDADDEDLADEYADDEYADDEYSDDEYAEDEDTDEDTDDEDDDTDGEAVDADGADDASEESADDWEDVEVPDDASSLTSDDDDKPTR